MIWTKDVETKITPLMQCPTENPINPILTVDAADASKLISTELTV